jgi:hypothetical protein
METERTRCCDRVRVLCIKLLDADEPDSVGEDGREGVELITDEEESLCELLLVLDDQLTAEGEAGLGFKLSVLVPMARPVLVLGFPWLVSLATAHVGMRVMLQDFES